jgi:hypothetical protein
MQTVGLMMMVFDNDVDDDDGELAAECIKACHRPDLTNMRWISE